MDKLGSRLTHSERLCGFSDTFLESLAQETTLFWSRNPADLEQLCRAAQQPVPFGAQGNIAARQVSDAILSLLKQTS